MRSLAPREHGAYGQLGFPLLTALCAATPRLPGLLFAAAAVVLFLGHEPALVAFGRRGERAREEDGARALRVLLLLLSAGGLLGAAGLWLSPGSAPRLGAGVAAALAALLTGAVALGVEKTLPGELIAAAAMTSASLPVATADGLRWVVAVSIWGAWLFGFAAAVFPVRAVIVEHKTRDPSAVARVAGALLAIAFAAALAAMGELPAAFVLADIPLFAAAIWIAVRPPPMKRMTRVGWMLMGAGALTTIAMTVAVHAAV